MGHADFCPTCGDILGGWDDGDTLDCRCVTGIDSNNRVVDREAFADYIVEQLDFATDAVVEAQAYFAKVFARSPLLGNFTPFDAARIRLALARAEQEVTYLVSGEEETGEQVRREADDSGRNPVRVEAGGGEVSGTPCACGGRCGY